MKFSEFSTSNKEVKIKESAKSVNEGRRLTEDEEEDLKRQMEELRKQLEKARNSGDKKTAFLIGGDLAAVMCKLMDLDLFKRTGQKIIHAHTR